MKRSTITIICVIAVLLIAGIVILAIPRAADQDEAATAEDAAEPMPQQTADPISGLNQSEETGYITGADGQALDAKMKKNDVVNIIGELNDYYIVESEDANLLIEKRFLRPDTEDDPAEKQGYVKAGTQVYKDAYLNGEVIAGLPENTLVTVADYKANWMFVKWDGGEGYISIDEFISEGSSDIEEIIVQNDESQDGGEIDLSGEDDDMVEEEEIFIDCAGRILSDNVEAYIYLQ